MTELESTSITTPHNTAPARVTNSTNTLYKNFPKASKHPERLLPHPLTTLAKETTKFFAQQIIIPFAQGFGLKLVYLSFLNFFLIPLFPRRFGIKN
ncbi:hypothetical protein CONCODRAFT_77574 [Conidiobolus coronatus NRRL 28638]|uniref:Uncharacterized protein n=1 Tax=Conidiobolus coronatus (strain ATCC 28846 / CBS 209.66 / NRRL 28638) TaxID=796925 RepID=A0A137PD60_CONC2|nr:hypothetical protein CONCODRAFT_77574 [Conidiobolus coronatus NRRL 28638]|eukprot:KXN72936.1 hypothetical protein CONCODRAFT_77574 [Conidiobolus coronatus NRRL 28638]